MNKSIQNLSNLFQKQNAKKSKEIILNLGGYAHGLCYQGSC